MNKLDIEYQIIIDIDDLLHDNTTDKRIALINKFHSYLDKKFSSATPEARQYLSDYFANIVGRPNNYGFLLTFRKFVRFLENPQLSFSYCRYEIAMQKNLWTVENWINIHKQHCA